MHFGLALLVSISALSLADPRAQEKPDEVASIAKIRALGGEIKRKRDLQPPSKKNEVLAENPVLVIELGGSEKLRDADLECLKVFDSLVGLYLGGTATSDAGLKTVSGLKHLAQLDLNGTKVTDAGLKELGGLQELSTLILADSEVTNGGLRELARLQKLKRLALSGTAISDAGLVELGKITHLAFLDLSGTKITDAGLKNLRTLKNLERLALVETNVTEAGVQELKASLRNVTIQRQSLGQRSDPDFDVTILNPAYKQKHPAVLFDEAHKNFHTASGRYKVLADLMTNDGYRVTPNKVPFTKEDLAKYDLLIAANAPGLASESKSAFTEAECDCVEQWVRQGGSLLLITDHEPFGSGSERLGKRFGVNMSLLVTVDPPNETSNGLLFAREKNQLGDHPIMRGRDASERVDRILTFTGQSLTGPPGSVALLKFADTAVDEGRGKRISAKGRAQGIALRLGKGRVVVMGEAGDLSAQVYGDPPQRMGMNVPGCDNRKMALNIVHWLSGLTD